MRDNEQAYYERLGALIRQRRKNRRLTQVGLAELWGLNRTTVVNIERGRQRVSVFQLVVLADHLGCTPRELIPKLDEEHHLSEELRDKAPDDLARTFVSEISAASKEPT